ncbi:hypothetical protein BaRGS_00000430 [Batillaria attramentaria]|uniref:Uncharacterized protein n=1 Tax=Batillaria attramentaria TaxID=370345 RepID=A0ABD0M9Z7_9CAEN
MQEEGVFNEGETRNGSDGYKNGLLCVPLPKYHSHFFMPQVALPAHHASQNFIPSVPTTVILVFRAYLYHFLLPPFHRGCGMLRVHISEAQTRNIKQTDDDCRNKRLTQTWATVMPHKQTTDVQRQVPVFQPTMTKCPDGAHA